MICLRKLSVQHKKNLNVRSRLNNFRTIVSGVASLVSNPTCLHKKCTAVSGRNINKFSCSNHVVFTFLNPRSYIVHIIYGFQIYLRKSQETNFRVKIPGNKNVGEKVPIF